MGLDLTIDAAWGLGLVLATTRVGAFVASSAVLGRAVPAVGRLAFTLVVGLFVTHPVAGVDGVPSLVALGVVNAAVGAALGFLVTLVFHLFAVAGGLIDVSSMLSASQVFDPTQGEQQAVVARLFTLTATVLVAVSGGFAVLAGLVATSVRAIPLDGAPQWNTGLAEVALAGIRQVVVVGIEVGMPALAVLFLLELVLGVAARFAPQANIFLVGMPAKLLVTLFVVSTCFLLFPEAIDGVMTTARTTAVEVLRAFGADG